MALPQALLLLATTTWYLLGLGASDLPTLIVFACCYVDEPIRYVLMQVHLFRGKWIKPVTQEGRAALATWKPER